MSEEIYVVTDIESDGPIPGVNSMRSLGSVAVKADGERLGTYTCNLEPCPGAIQDPDTMTWWSGKPRAWELCNENRLDPQEAMPEYAVWLKSLPGKVVFVGYPVAFDFMFTAWYLHRFAKECPFGWSGLDVKTLVMIYTGGDYMGSGARAGRDLARIEYPHVALRDAHIEAEFFLEVLSRVRSGQQKWPKPD